ncbi:hypothetical protein VHA01S_008_00620 [Vibrio halioticoli NBRC 102217]|uniref:Uncharacterized protein n=1 Tax=Vibrio halioticoli NBRC 102217 TaxID=1219072 RepID=V5FFI6_9VIBR|nr:hypothetical protein [Vibrio sp. B1Z05]GAD88666.1 hypothetical protein VHA01S_008_00620 [Vibrio halioticoli NBRC 102217]
MEVVIYNCDQECEIERFCLSPYKMDAFLEEIRYENRCELTDNSVLVRLYDAGRLTLSKRLNLTDQLTRLLKSNKTLLA